MFVMLLRLILPLVRRLAARFPDWNESLAPCCTRRRVASTQAEGQPSLEVLNRIPNDGFQRTPDCVSYHRLSHL
jgi:hypothetical protein